MLFHSSRTESSFSESPCNTICTESLNDLNRNHEELIAENKTLKEQLFTLETALEEMKKAVNLLAKKVQTDVKLTTISQSARIDQNIPNPFNGATKIHYYLPDNSESARILIFDITGQIVESYELNGSGEGELLIQINAFSSGIYQYSLEIDGKIIDTKKMSFTK